MHVHMPMRVDATIEADVATLGLSHKCDSCGREFTKQRGLRVHMARWFDGVLRLPAESIARRSLLALVKGGTHYPDGSLFSECEAALPQLEALSLDRPAWRAKVSSLT